VSGKGNRIGKEVMRKIISRPLERAYEHCKIIRSVDETP